MQIRAVNNFNNQNSYNKKTSFKAATKLIEESAMPIFIEVAKNSPKLCEAIANAESSIILQFGKTNDFDGFYAVVNKGVQGIKEGYGFCSDFKGMRTPQQYAYVGNAIAEGFDIAKNLC